VPPRFDEGLVGADHAAVRACLVPAATGMVHSATPDGGVPLRSSGTRRRRGRTTPSGARSPREPTRTLPLRRFVSQLRLPPAQPSPLMQRVHDRVEEEPVHSPSQTTCTNATRSLPLEAPAHVTLCRRSRSPQRVTPRCTSPKARAWRCEICSSSGSKSVRIWWAGPSPELTHLSLRARVPQADPQPKPPSGYSCRWRRTRRRASQ